MRPHSAITRLLVVFVACLGVVTISRGESRSSLAYTFTPDLRGPVPVLHVELSFQGNSGGESVLILPTTWAGQVDLFRSVQNLRSLDPAISTVATNNPGEFLLHYPPAKKIRIAYDLLNDWTGSLRHPKEFRAVVSNSDIVFNGQNGLVHPELGPNAQVRVDFTWNELPRGWEAASSFGTQAKHLKFNGEWHEVSKALFAVGDFRLTRVQRAGERVTLAVRGSWLFSDTQAAEEVVNIFRVEREFWGERKASSYLVVLAPYDQDLGSSDGTVFTNCFLLYLSRKQTLMTDEKSLLAHEVFHTWNPYRMGAASGEDTEWFTEGFTRYYQDRVLLQAGLIDYPQYLERLNRIVAAYWLSPDRNWTQSQWLSRTETHNAEYELPYSRGAIIALWTDQVIRRNTSNHDSLDHRMFSLLRSKPDIPLTTDYLLSSLEAGMSAEEVAALRSFVVDGVTVPLPEELTLNCGELTPEGSNPRYTLEQGQCGASLASPGGR
jgi:predicted metalloprotease with PDZ domain